MIRYAFSKLKEKKYIIQGIIFFVLFLGLYFILDYLNFREAAKVGNEPSTTLVIINGFLNVIMAGLSMLLINLSTVMVEIKASGDKGSNLGIISIVFGIFTYGCTGCVVAFFTTIGISFSPTIFPFIDIANGLLYKLLSLVLIGIGFVIVLHNIARGRCKVNLK